MKREAFESTLSLILEEKLGLLVINNDGNIIIALTYKDYVSHKYVSDSDVILQFGDDIGIICVDLNSVSLVEGPKLTELKDGAKGDEKEDEDKNEIKKRRFAEKFQSMFS